MRVLVVDDSVDSADSLALLLSMWGHDAEVSYNGKTAVRIARTYRPDVVLLDIAMPSMDGFQAAQRLHEQPDSRHAVLIALTGQTSEVCRDRARELGFCQYLTKPADLDQLQAMLGCAALQRTTPVTANGVVLGTN